MNSLVDERLDPKKMMQLLQEFFGREQIEYRHVHSFVTMSAKAPYA